MHYRVNQLPMIAYLVEDSPTQGFAMQKMLEQVPNLQVTLITDGLTALRAIRSKRPDLLCLDMVLPSLEGLALCRLLKFHQDFQEIPILMFTECLDQTSEARARQAGADDFMAKPVQPLALQAKVVDLLLKYRGAATTHLDCSRCR